MTSKLFTVDELLEDKLPSSNISNDEKDNEECHLTESFNLTKPAEVNRVAWMRSVAKNKLSRDEIVQDVWFLEDDEALIKIRRTERGCGNDPDKDNWTSNQAIFLPYHPSSEGKRLKPADLGVKAKLVDRPEPPD
ncbi:hypothetical protein AVEN_14938-1 [Araneus ventricosus]|uniref:Uncharacterized protein n=1 Tax=Araneus ventricosus TaxID=182803 RepID=A0A4Y2MC88_ARAVE|nr:hypothetical protein AVEN_14938-1 [Araneus ventricosus]